MVLCMSVCPCATTSDLSASPPSTLFVSLDAILACTKDSIILRYVYSSLGVFAPPNKFSNFELQKNSPSLCRMPMIRVVSTEGSSCNLENSRCNDLYFIYGRISADLTPVFCILFLSSKDILFSTVVTSLSNSAFSMNSWLSILFNSSTTTSSFSSSPFNKCTIRRNENIVTGASPRNSLITFLPRRVLIYDCITCMADTRSSHEYMLMPPSSSLTLSPSSYVDISNGLFCVHTFIPEPSTEYSHTPTFSFLYTLSIVLLILLKLGRDIPASSISLSFWVIWSSVKIARPTKFPGFTAIFFLDK
ncbi:hypothetical protein NEPAR08_2458 [Nematocida parisii]|nr:hypothetical protein NEPAR03_2435 [Nematocida parisii]KAI5131448.1 hypothetical protein NEPAR08_2458 [Nematocida parisii]